MHALFTRIDHKSVETSHFLLLRSRRSIRLVHIGLIETWKYKESATGVVSVASSVRYLRRELDDVHT